MTSYQLYKDHTPAVESALRASIKRFGVLVPVAYDQHGNVLDGHQRLRIAGELGVPVPTSTHIVASEEEAREIARTLNEDRRAMPRAERLEVVKALREEGHSQHAIAGALGVHRTQVQRDLKQVDTPCQPDRTTGLDGKSYPATRKGLSRTAPATRERERQIEQLAREGHTAEQIGAVVGMSRESVKNAARRADIALTAETVTCKTRRLEPERVISQTVANLEAEAMSLSLLPAHYAVKPEQAREWADSLAESLTRLRGLLKTLRSIAP